MEFPITVRVGTASTPDADSRASAGAGAGAGLQDIDVTVQMAEPLPFSEVGPHICRAAGLDPETPLFHGIGAVEDDWLVGSPPLIAGCVLGTSPVNNRDDEPTVALAVIAGPSAGATIELSTRAITVGRGGGVDLMLDDPAVSIRHARFEPTATGVEVTDCHSTNGVFIDGVAVQGSGLATSGATIRVGDSILQMQLTTELAGGFEPDGRGYLQRKRVSPRQAETLPPLPAPPQPPHARVRRALPIASIAVGALVGGGLALLLHQVMFLAFAAFGPLTMAATAVSDRVRGRRSYRRQRADYRRANAGWTRQRDEIARAERAMAWRTWPGPAELSRRARTASASLWNRGPADPAYMALSVGSGRRPSRARSVSEPHTDTEALLVADVPITAEARGALMLPGSQGRALAWWMLAQLVTFRSPTHTALLLIDARADLRPCLDLPHTIVADTSDLATLDGLDIGSRDLVVVLDGDVAIASPLGSAAIAAASSGDSSTGHRPRTCVLCLPDTGGSVQPSRPSQHPADRFAAAPGADRPAAAVGVHTYGGGLALTTIDASMLATLCRYLMPLRDASRPGSLPLPTSVDLTTLVGKIDARTLRETWQRPTARATLGTGPYGPVTIDLDADGPHLLIAGTTGSGKSELLQTLVSGLALHASPGELTLLLIDYKGGAAFDAVSALPHVVGVLTDLSPGLSARALASLRAELRKRERRQAAGESPGAKLVVVIDEFATLAVELPEFLAGLLDIAQRGRSLGVHLVLATQRPAGVVSPAMRANISTRICLRVTDPADSADVIDSADAAGLSPRHPGRAIIRTHEGRTMFQAARVSAPSAPRLRVSTRCTVSTSADANTDGADVHRTADVDAHPSAGAPTVGEAHSALQELLTAAQQAVAGRPAPERPWLPPLPHDFSADACPSRALALADVPDEQRQEIFDAPETSLLVTGPAGSGRTSALRRIATIATHQGHELAVVDPTGAMADLRGWPSVTTYLDLDQPRLVLRLLTLLSDAELRPADGRLRHMIIDHYDLVAAELERTDYLTGSALLTELITRGGGMVRMSASGPHTLAQGRAAMHFPSIIELGSDDASLTGPSRRTNRPEAGADAELRADTTTGSIPGRGRWNGLEVQLAHEPPRPGRTAAPPRPWPDALVVRPLPTAVHVTDLPSPKPAQVPIGIGGDAAAPMFIDLTRQGEGIVVAGPRRSGVTTALEVIAEQASRAGVPVIRVIDSPPRQDCTRTTEAHGTVVRIDIRAGIEPLRVALAAHTGPLLLVVDGHGLGADHPAAALFEHFLSVCDEGQHLLLGERLNTLARARRGFVRAALDRRRGLLLCPDAADGAALDVTLPKRTAAVQPGRGVWADEGTALPIQVAAPCPTSPQG